MAVYPLSRRDLLVLFGATSAGAAGASVAYAEDRGKPVDLAAKQLSVPLTEPILPATPEQEEAAKRVGRSVVCLCGTCPKRLIHDCECGWAAQNRNVIVNALQRGDTEASIVEGYRTAFGDQVLAMLPNEGFAVAAWALPYAVAGVGLVAAVGVGLRYVKRKGDAVGDDLEGTAPGSSAPDDGDREALRRELEDLD